MTIKAFRLYFRCRDKAVESAVTRAHWGVSYWLNHRLKEIAPMLKGPEVRGINLANVHFAEPGGTRTQIGAWRRILNGLEYTVEYDTASLALRPARENLPELLEIAAAAAATSTYPQLRAIGSLLSSPLTESQLDEIQAEIDVPLEVRLEPARRKLERYKALVNTSLDRPRDRKSAKLKR